LKKIFLVLIVLLLSGCSVEYRLNFNDNNLEEIVTLNIMNNEKNKIEELKQNQVYAISDVMSQQLYDVTYEDNKVIYKYNYSFETIKRALYINQCFDAIGFTKENDEYIILTSEGFNCMNYSYVPVDGVTVKITSNRKVIDSNADKVNNDEYIWEINDQNASKKSIYIKFGEVKKSFFNKKTIGIISLSIIVFSVISVIGYIAIQNKKNNAI